MVKWTISDKHGLWWHERFVEQKHCLTGSDIQYAFDGSVYTVFFVRKNGYQIYCRISQSLNSRSKNQKGTGCFRLVSTWNQSFRSRKINTEWRRTVHAEFRNGSRNWKSYTRTIHEFLGCPIFSGINLRVRTANNHRVFVHLLLQGTWNTSQYTNVIMLWNFFLTLPLSLCTTTPKLGPMKNLNGNGFLLGYPEKNIRELTQSDVWQLKTLQTNKIQLTLGYAF